MKIGIITQSLRVNYGGLLQNFALQYALKRLNYDVVTIDQPCANDSYTVILLSSIKTFTYILSTELTTLASSII